MNKKDFTIFENHKNLIYLDSAATTQLPKTVINKVKFFQENNNANIHRGIYKLSAEATQEYENARKTIAKSINSDAKEIIFTSGTTDGINKLARSLPKLFKKKSKIVLTISEHHSNIVPWQINKNKNMNIQYISLDKNNNLYYKEAKKLIDKNTAIVSISHIGNALGNLNDIKKIISYAKSVGALTIIDAAQSIGRTKIDVKDLNCDFLVFSGHKTYGPTGIGAIYMKKEILNKIPVFDVGGDMIDSVTKEKTIFSKNSRKFEAGTQNLSGAIGLAEAISYINKIGIKKIEKHEKELTEYTIKELNNIAGIQVYSPKNSLGIVSFNAAGIHPHDLAQILSDKNIAVRAGHHCAMPLMKNLKIPGTIRISFGIYNDKSDIDKLIKAIKKAQEVFR
jgi:cysteine desulfurase / selenocysteine lyase